MRLSIIISVLNSHEIVRRQLLHFERLNLPSDVEVILMDDGSDPPLTDARRKIPNLQIISTNNPDFTGRKDGLFNDNRVSVARNMGARLAQGEFLLMTDIDYIIPIDAIEAGRNLQYDKQGFRRQLGVLLENGVISQDYEVLKQYGVSQERLDQKGISLPPHTNNFIMRKSTFFDIGGYRENLGNKGYPSRGDTWFKRDWSRYYEEGKATISPDRTILLMFPNGRWCKDHSDVDYNPFGLFHTLSRRSDRNPYHE